MRFGNHDETIKAPLKGRILIATTNISDSAGSIEGHDPGMDGPRPGEHRFRHLG